MKVGVVALVGRPNVGKSTLINNLVGQKVSITSPKPQTTRFPIQAVYEDDRGQIIFVDTPGIFGETPDTLSKVINERAEVSMSKNIDLIVYMIDPTRARDTEENKTLGLVRKIPVPKILVINKSDIKKPRFASEYAFYEDEFPKVIKISALSRANLNLLLEEIFNQLSSGEPMVDTKTLVQPGLNLDSKLFIAELIREKVFLMTQKEVPYTVHTEVDEITERTNGTLYVKARIITTDDRYKKILIGKEGIKIREIGMLARKELEQAAGKQVYIDLSVETNPHWPEML